MLKKLIGYRIKELRINYVNVNQDDFAKSLGWDRTYLSRVESGKQNITIDSLEKVCEVIGISYKDFFIYMDKEHIEEDS